MAPVGCFGPSAEMKWKKQMRKALLHALPVIDPHEVHRPLANDVVAIPAR